MNTKIRDTTHSKFQRVFNNHTVRFVLLLLFLVFCFVIGKQTHLEVERYRVFLSQFPLIVSGIIFVALYAFLTFFIWFGAKDVLRIVCAIVFGSVISTLYVWMGEQVNAYFLFNLSRHFGRDFIVEKFKLKSQQIKTTQKDSSFLGVLALRLNPLVPFRFMDLSAGLTRISFSKYFWIIFLATPVRIFGFQYILAEVGESIFKRPQDMMDYLTNNPVVIIYSMIYLGVLIVLSITAVVARKWRKAI